MQTVKLRIEGKAEQRGSKVPVRLRNGECLMKNGTPILRDANKKSTKWMDAVARQASLQHRGELLQGPLRLSICFRFTRPNKHYRTGRYAHLLRDDAPREYKSTMPDLSKLVRAFEDALTGVVWVDDAQVAEYGRLRKIWTAGEPYVTAVVQTLDESSVTVEQRSLLQAPF